jgi:hypothetical protein
VTRPANDLATTAVAAAGGDDAAGWPSALLAFLLDGAGEGDRLAWGARLAAVGADADAVRLGLERDGASVVAWLRPRATGGAAYRTTEHFLIGHEGDALDPAALRLLADLHDDVVRREGSLPAALLAALRESRSAARSELPMPIEWLAVRAGAKPAARSVPSGAAVGDQLAAAAERHGLRALAVEASEYLADFATGDAVGCRTIVYVGATSDAVAAARAAEAAMIAAVARGEPVTPALNAALGRALGYPECCIAAFAPRCDLPNAALRFEALRATGATAFALLNDVDPERTLISHFVCRYDCAASLRYARRVLDAVAAVDAPRAQRLSRALASVLILFRDGGAIELGEARAAGADRWRFGATTVLRTPSADDRWCDVFSDADEVEIGRGVLTPFRDGRPLAARSFDAERVQVRPFVGAP